MDSLDAIVMLEAKIMVLEQDNEMLEETVSMQSAEINRLRQENADWNRTYDKLLLEVNRNFVEGESPTQGDLE